MKVSGENWSAEDRPLAVWQRISFFCSLSEYVIRPFDKSSASTGIKSLKRYGVL